jgi:HD-GYP domain-containing protein (c-di-GMP phosphodiesterase class II)
MARKVKIDSDTLIGLIDQFYAEKCDGNTELLKIPQIGEYARSKGCDVADYLIRRNSEAKVYIKKLQENTEETHIHTVAVYRDLDMDAFLMKNNTKEKLKKALKERENYYKQVTNSASYSFKENKRLEQQVMEYKKRIKELEEKIEFIENKNTGIGYDSRNDKAENQKLRAIIETYVYPEIANELLKQQGLLKNTAGIVNPDAIKGEIASAETDVTEIRSKVVKKLFDSI